MTRNYRIILIAVIVVAAAAGLLYWQHNKTAIIENKIDKAVAKKSGKLFELKYDSSSIDELKGNASFYNVSLISDTMVAAATDAKNIYKVHVREVSIRGANVLGMLSGNNLEANAIHFINPVFEITKRNQSAPSYTKEDTLALYEQILGNYKSIRAGRIVIENGSVNISNQLNKTVTAVNNMEVSLSDFKIDSTKDYESLVSYFIKGLEAKVGSVSETAGASQRYQLSGITFSAANRRLGVKDFRLFKNNKAITNFSNLSLDGLETNVFLREQRMVANELRSDGGLLTVYRKKGKGSNTLETDSSVFDRAKIRKVVIGKTRVVIIDKDQPNAPPFILSNVELTAADIPEVDGSLNKLIAQSNWEIKGDEVKSLSKNKMYEMKVGPYVVNKATKIATFAYFSVIPTMTEASFVKSRKVQEDFFEVRCNNIMLRNIDLEEVFSKQILRASELSLQPTIKISNDRTLPRNPKSKLGTDPAELVKNLPIPVDIDKIVIRNGSVSYKERGMISAKTGIVFFDNLNATITNISNIASVIKEKPQMELNARARFLGQTNFETRWRLPLGKPGNPFTLDGKLSGIEAGKLNPVLEPLAMISVKEGRINSFAFETSGNQSQARTRGTFLYDNLKLNLLKKENDKIELQKKSALSFLANIFIDDRNPGKGSIRQNEVDFKRDSSRSFFYLVSQSFFLSIRKTITGKNNVK